MHNIKSFVRMCVLDTWNSIRGMNMVIFCACVIDDQWVGVALIAVAPNRYDNLLGLSMMLKNLFELLSIMVFRGN